MFQYLFIYIFLEYLNAYDNDYNYINFPLGSIKSYLLYTVTLTGEYNTQ